MKLERYEVHFSDEYYEPYESDANGDWVRWALELQEAWDKQQEVDVIDNGYGVKFCSKCHGTVWQNKDESKYCFRCGTKLKW